MKIRELKNCRACGNTNIEEVLDIGIQELTGVFPKDDMELLTEGPLRLVLCPKCGLLQLAHSYALDEMYGENYGYRSGLNSSMVQHLQQKVKILQKLCNPKPGDVVLDIGSNDGTTLNAYDICNLRKVGMDPTGNKFRKYYHDDVELVSDFFSAEGFKTVSDKKAKIVTSLSMFYDLENPIEFASSVAEILAEDGIWHFEQSYMPTMLRQNAYDTVCHEHLEYYSLSVVKYILEVAGLKIIDVWTNDINGGSFAVTAAQRGSKLQSNEPLIKWMLAMEDNMKLKESAPYIAFADNVRKHREAFINLLDSLQASGKKVYGYGASTKGNVILQYCGISEAQITAFAEVNPDKFGAFTPKTHIPIRSENDIKRLHPDYFVVMPWHFRSMILEKEKDFLLEGGKMIFPLPYIDIV